MICEERFGAEATKGMKHCDLGELIYSLFYILYICLILFNFDIGLDQHLNILFLSNSLSVE